MKHRRRKYFLAGLCLAALLVVGTGIYQFDRVLNDLLRPLIEKTAASRLSAEVRIGRISLASEALTLSDISIHRPNRYRVALAHTEIGVSFSGLTARRIDRLHLSAPDLELWKPSQPAPSPEMPPAPRWGVKRLLIEKGRFTYRTADQRYVLDQIRAESQEGAPFGFRVSALLGAPPGLPLSVHGRGTWGARQEITVDRIQVGEHQLLATPLKLTLPEAGGPLVSGGMALARFTSDDLAKITSALGTPAAPGGWDFELLEPTAEFRLDADGAAVAVRVAAAEIQSPNVKLPLEGVAVALSNPSGEWQGEGRFLMAGTAPGEFSVRHGDGALRGNFSLNIPRADALWRRLWDIPLPGLAGGLSLTADFTQEAGALSLQADLDGLPAKEKPAEYGVDLQPLAARLQVRQSGTSLSGEFHLQVEGREVFSAMGTREKIRFQLLPTPWQALTAAAGPALLPAALKPESGGGLSGSLSADGEVTMDPSGIRMYLDALTGREIDYLSADGMTGLGGGRFKVQGAITAKPGEAALKIDLDAQMAAQEVLRGSFYADVSGLTATADLRATLAPAQRRLQAHRIGLSVDGLGTAGMKGSIAPGAIQMDGAFSAPTLKGLFADVLKSILGETVTGIDTLQLSGALAADFRLLRDGTVWQASGSMRPAKIDLAWPSADFRLEKASGVLPFFFSSDPNAAAQAAAPRSGNFTFSRLAVGPLELEPAAIRLHAAANHLFVDTPLVFGVAGGRLEIEDISTELGESGPDVRARIRIVDVDLERLTEELGGLALKGRLAADLGKIRYAGDVFDTAGTMEISVFGGDILVRNMRLESPLTPYASFFADIDFTGLDLFQLTRTLSFGEMNGIADGYVHRLRLFGKTPSRFAAAFATRESGKRNISVKALNNLTVISQGGISEALSRGIYQFIDFYRYRKIGIACTLEKDVFRLQGTARADSARYLVDGGILPPRIDVVISSPTISFTEMVKRLQRIERTGG